MSSNPLYGLRKVGTFVQLTGLPGRPVRQPVFAGCTRRLWVCDRRLWLVTKSALEVCIHDDALYKLTTFTFTFYLSDRAQRESAWCHRSNWGNNEEGWNATLSKFMQTEHSHISQQIQAVHALLTLGGSEWDSKTYFYWWTKVQHFFHPKGERLYNVVDHLLFQLLITRTSAEIWGVASTLSNGTITNQLQLTV